MLLRTAAFSLSMILAGGALAVPAGPVFTVIPSDVQPPDGVAVGSFRRSFQPFDNWTLICDEDLLAQKRICNIRQEIAIEGAGKIFSWAMAATDTGQERMVISAPQAIGEGGKIEFAFEGGATYAAQVNCTAVACTTTVPVGPQIRRHIENELDIRIRFYASPVGHLEFRAPMKGLADALKAVGH